jgi:hypothetical protein
LLHCVLNFSSISFCIICRIICPIAC